jgi:hypothetical protein
MHQAMQQWIGKNLPRPGIRAFGLRLPDQTCFSSSLTPEFDPRHLDDAWQSLSELANALSLQRIPALRLRWIYENGFLYFVMRPDGVALGLLTAQFREGPITRSVDQLISEFVAFTG